MDRRELDCYLDAVLVGGREKPRIEIVGYDPGWPERFAAERERIRDALGSIAVRIEHIGSTSVPGLAAKPIVDLLVTVIDADDEGTFLPELESAGYVLRVREAGHRMFRTADRAVNVYIWGDSDPEVERYLTFREYLRNSSQAHHAYERLKRELARRRWPDVNHYANAKGPFIEETLAHAPELAAFPDGL